MTGNCTGSRRGWIDMTKRTTQRPRKWSAKKRRPKAEVRSRKSEVGKAIIRAGVPLTSALRSLTSVFQQPDGPRHDSQPWRGE